MQEGVCHNLKIAEQMQLLSRRLKNTGGKKVYVLFCKLNDAPVVTLNDAITV